MSAALAVFWLSLLLVAWVYFGYPGLLYLLARLRPRPHRRGPVRPSVTLIVPAHNEERVIGAKLRNCLDLDYPPEALDVLVVSDGSTDLTEAIVGREPDPRVRLIALARGGKALALNRGAAEARGEVLVLTDANAMLERSSLARLVESFSDPAVGGVCGNKRFRSPAGADATGEGEGLYWRYEKWQKALEGRIGSVYAADGSLHALRRALYVPIADPAQADDIALSTRVVLQGYRLVYEPEAVAWEEAPAEGRDELRRKVRVTNHSVRALLGLRAALLSSGFYSLELVSHKLLRHLVAFFLIALLAATACLAFERPAFRILLVLQLLFYALGALGFALRARPAGRRPWLSVPSYFCLVNGAALLGVLSILGRRRLETWAPRGGIQP